VTGFTSKEMMAIAAAREIRDGDIVFCGTGISILAAIAAKHISAPDSVIFFETGAVDARLAEIPLAVGDSRVMHGMAVSGSLADAFAFMQNRNTGRRVVGILGAAQIDPYGNLNSTAIGDYIRPQVRLAGSGGASDVAAFVGRTIVFMQHEKRKFVPELDYRTSPGWLGGGDQRDAHGLPPGGPATVITNRARLGFDPDTRRMYLEAVFPGSDPEAIQRETGFDLDVSRAREMAPPTAEELRILRETCDPQRLILGA